jgi:hypothetical protein
VLEDLQWRYPICWQPATCDPADCSDRSQTATKTLEVTLRWTMGLGNNVPATQICRKMGYWKRKGENTQHERWPVRTVALFKMYKQFSTDPYWNASRLKFEVRTFFLCIRCAILIIPFCLFTFFLHIGLDAPTLAIYVSSWSLCSLEGWHLSMRWLRWALTLFPDPFS